MLRVIILPGTHILKVGSRISNWSRFHFFFLTFYVTPSHLTRPGATRNKKKQLLGNYPIRNSYLEFISDLLGKYPNTIWHISVNDKLGKGIIVWYQPEKIRQRRYEQKLNTNDQYAMQSRENESRFHYLWREVQDRHDPPSKIPNAWRNIPMSLLNRKNIRKAHTHCFFF